MLHASSYVGVPTGGFSLKDEDERRNEMYEKSNEIKTEEEISRLEQETMERELNHLLYNILPQQWSKITNEIRQALIHLSGGTQVFDDEINKNEEEFSSQDRQQQPIQQDSKRNSTSPTLLIQPPSSPTSPSKHLMTPTSPTAPISSFSNTLSSSSSNHIERIQLNLIDPQSHSVAKGFLQIQGYRILFGKINFKLHKMKHSFEVEIKAGDPYTLSQVQRAHHLTEYAYYKLKNLDIEHFGSENNNLNNEDINNNKIRKREGSIFREIVDEDMFIMLNNHEEIDEHEEEYMKMKRDVIMILTTLERVMVLIQQGREQLTMYGGLRFLSDEYRLATLISEKTNIDLLQQSFHPPLPKESLIEFSITESNLHVGIYGLSYTSIASFPQMKSAHGSHAVNSSSFNLSNIGGSASPSSDNSSNSNSGNSGTSTVIRNYNNTNRHFMTEDNEIGYFSEEYVAKFKVSSFSKGLYHLTNAFKLCSQLRNLLTTHGVL
ncbi:hypothetical protein ABK040_000548 [Willaertia magna]